MGRGRAWQRLERAREAVFTALAAVSSYLDSDEDLPVFFGRLSETVAGLVRARRAGFWRLGPQGVLSLQPTALGLAADSPIPALRIARGPRRARAADPAGRGGHLQGVGGPSPELGSS